MFKGKLYIVSTPIGNLTDITLRALEVLKSVDLILSEDTRETEKVLKQYNFSKPQISYRDQNHTRVIQNIKDMLSDGKTLALVSDSGTPLISDPGFKLVNELSKVGVEIITIPGPSAVIAALSVSGMPTDKFTFIGFLPKSGAHRKKVLKEYGSLDTSIVVYESPFRIVKCLEEILEVLGDRSMFLCNDLTKIYEKVWRGKVSEVLSQVKTTKLKGEFVVIVSKEGF